MQSSLNEIWKVKPDTSTISHTGSVAAIVGQASRSDSAYSGYSLERSIFSASCVSWVWSTPNRARRFYRQRHRVRNRVCAALKCESAPSFDRTPIRLSMSGAAGNRRFSEDLIGVQSRPRLFTESRLLLQRGAAESTGVKVGVRFTTASEVHHGCARASVLFLPLA